MSYMSAASDWHVAPEVIHLRRSKFVKGEFHRWYRQAKSPWHFGSFHIHHVLNWHCLAHWQGILKISIYDSLIAGLERRIWLFPGAIGHFTSRGNMFRIGDCSAFKKVFAEWTSGRGARMTVATQSFPSEANQASPFAWPFSVIR